MNKYQETLKKQIEYAEFTENSVVCLDIEVAKGLLNILIETCEKAEKYDKKETPKKVIKLPYKDIYGSVWGDSTTHYYNGCPVCKNNVGIDANYCRLCGQKLDWSDKNE